MANGNGTIAVVRNYWPIITAFVVLAAGYGGNTVKLANAENDIDGQEERIQTIEKDLGEVKTSIAKIETNQEHSTQDIEDIEDMLQRILDKLNAGE